MARLIVDAEGSVGTSVDRISDLWLLECDIE
jgi:hypothetical protein